MEPCAVKTGWMLQVQRTGTLSRPGEEAPPKMEKSGQVITRCTLRCMLQLDLFVYRSMGWAFGCVEDRLGYSDSARLGC